MEIVKFADPSWRLRTFPNDSILQILAVERSRRGRSESVANSEKEDCFEITYSIWISHIMIIMCTRMAVTTRSVAWFMIRGKIMRWYQY